MEEIGAVESIATILEMEVHDGREQQEEEYKQTTRGRWNGPWYQETTQA